MKQKLTKQTTTSIEFKFKNIFSFKRKYEEKFESESDSQDKDYNKIEMIKPMKVLLFIFSFLSKLSISESFW